VHLYIQSIGPEAAGATVSPKVLQYFGPTGRDIVTTPAGDFEALQNNGQGHVKQSDRQVD